MPAESPEGDIAADAKKEGSAADGSKLGVLGSAVMRWWGILFRALFIATLGIVGYSWLDPQSIGDVPFGEITPNQIFNNLFSVLIVFGCVYWFFNFPDQGDSNDPDSNPYDSWGGFGVGIVCFIVLIILWLNKK
jgi:hypothetical protein